ncbi:MAG: cytochrome b [Alphaproteobacteria bacterium]|nr:cytochrome b [Alphaproteobacteria bacterium]
MTIMTAPETTRYTSLSMAFHWGMAILIVGSWGIGTWMVDLEDRGSQFFWYQQHKSWGFVIFMLALMRLGWRFATPAPALPEGMKRYERLLAAGAHVLLYALMVAIPVTGWLMSSANIWGIETRVFDLFALPHPLAPSQETEAFWMTVHKRLTDALALLLLVHVAAALKHHYVDRDAVLRRMLPAGSKGRGRQD